MCASIDVLKDSSLQPPEPMKRLMSNVVREADRLNSLITDFLVIRAAPPDARGADRSWRLFCKDIMSVIGTNDQSAGPSARFTGSWSRRK